MKVYKCDRCGCYFDNEKRGYFGAIKVEADFCLECIKSLEKWIRMEDGEKSEDKA